MTEKQYPKLPEPEQATDDWSVGGVIVEYFTGDQMRAYVDADRAMRAARDAEDAARYRWLAAHPTAGIWVPTELAERVQETMGEFLMDHGWRQQDMDTSDEFGALLAVATKSAPAPASVAYRVLRKRHDGEWVTDGRAWCDGVPTQDLVDDIALRSDGWRIEYAFAAPTTQAAPQPAVQQGDAEQREVDARHAAIYRWMLSHIDDVSSIVDNWFADEEAGTDELHDVLAARAGISASLVAAGG